MRAFAPRTTPPAPHWPEALRQLAARLRRASERRAAQPRPDIDWPAGLTDEWFTSPELLSLYGTPLFEDLPESVRRRLAFFEAVNFFSLNLHGERFLTRGLAERAADPAWRDLAPYLDHFRADEARHSAYFGEFCLRYAGKVYPDRKVALPRPYAAGEEDFLFFARVLIFEEIADAHNRRMAHDERLSPLARRINHLHHLDETRHLAFGRALVPALFARCAPAWSVDTRERVRAELEVYVTAVWKEYVNPDVYRDAGLDHPYRTRELALADPHACARRHAMTRRCLRVLFEHEILTEVTLR